MIRRTEADTDWREYRDFLLSQLPTREGQAFAAWFKTFYQFQLEWLCEPARFSICNKSRQTGFSHTTGGVGTMWGVVFGETTTVVSLGEREAREVLDKAKGHAGLLRDFGSEWASIGDVDNKQEIRFVTGGRIVALPQTGARGFSGNVFIDEYGHMERPKQVWSAAAPVIMQGGYRLRVAGTPNGVGNDFHALCTDPKQNKGWAYHEIPLDRAIRDGMRVDIDDCWRIAKGDPRQFDEIFNCQFLDGSFQYIPSAAINACSVDDLYTYEGEFYGGLDIGRSADLTALVIGRKGSDGIVREQAMHTCKRTDQEALDDLVEYGFRQYRLRRLCVDATGLGTFPAESMQKRYGRTRVEPVVFTAPMKEELAGLLFSYFTNQLLQIAMTDESLPDGEPGAAERLRLDVAAIKREVTSAGNVRYDAPHTDEGHADSAWALALMLHAVGKPPSTKTVDATR